MGSERKFQTECDVEPVCAALDISEAKTNGRSWRLWRLFEELYRACEACGTFEHVHTVRGRADR
jgi:hypothetical protein